MVDELLEYKSRIRPVLVDNTSFKGTQCSTRSIRELQHQGRPEDPRVVSKRFDADGEATVRNLVFLDTRFHLEIKKRGIGAVIGELPISCEVFCLGDLHKIRSENKYGY